MATSIINRHKSELETKDETDFKKLVNIWFFPRIS